IGDNLKFMGEAVEDIMNVLKNYSELAEETKEKDVGLSTVARCEEACEEADIEFLREELPQAVEQSIQGVRQVSKIVLAMKEFAHPSSKEKTLVDLNRVVERSISVCKSEWKSVAQLEMQLDKNIPQVMALEGDLNQVVLNLVVNAAHAIEEKSTDIGHITVSTKAVSDGVVLMVKDSGNGMPEEIKERIFDPFFTTKEVGKGSGQGLAISHDIIVNKHGGRIDVESTENEGTIFTVKLLKVISE
ncbi:MAG: ATP-binding protein, partial [Rhodospirillales bacterium]|nr:ATP-binding protein [Rhodospirillales bacterium]